MTEEKLARLKEIEQVRYEGNSIWHVLSVENFDWLISELKKSVEREKVMREALESIAKAQYFIVLRESEALYFKGLREQGDRAREALAKVEEMK